ncbi:MAG: nitrilotriacetate monooxygenase family FMN-dependent oxidoreductase [Aeromicrobium sp.]|nr:nitrilotriacetate monooxygenase family FMN-dependent oxidoreductase [Aeromicrobium sp.]
MITTLSADRQLCEASAYAEDIRTRADNHGRDPESVKLIYGLQTIIDRDKSRANDRYAEFVDKVQIESALGILSGHTGFDFSTLGLDDNVVDADLQGIRGLFDAIREAKDGAPVTVREAAQIYGVSMGAPVAIGTPSDVADQMEQYIDEGAATASCCWPPIRSDASTTSPSCSCPSFSVAAGIEPAIPERHCAKVCKSIRSRCSWRPATLARTAAATRWARSADGSHWAPTCLAGRT